MLRNALTASLVLAAPAASAIDLSPGPQAHAGATREAIDAVLRWISTGIEVTGVGIIVVGAIGATVVFLYGGLVSVGWPAACISPLSREPRARHFAGIRVSGCR